MLDRDEITYDKVAKHDGELVLIDYLGLTGQLQIKVEPFFIWAVDPDTLLKLFVIVSYQDYANVNCLYLNDRNV